MDVTVEVAPVPDLSAAAVPDAAATVEDLDAECLTALAALDKRRPELNGSLRAMAEATLTTGSADIDTMKLLLLETEPIFHQLTEQAGVSVDMQARMRGLLLLVLQAGLLASFYGNDPQWLVIIARTLRMASALPRPQQLLDIFATSQHCRVVHCPLELNRAAEALEWCLDARQNEALPELQQVMQTSLPGDADEMREAISYKVGEIPDCDDGSDYGNEMYCLCAMLQSATDGLRQLLEMLQKPEMGELRKIVLVAQAADNATGEQLLTPQFRHYSDKVAQLKANQEQVARSGNVLDKKEEEKLERNVGKLRAAQDASAKGGPPQQQLHHSLPVLVKAVMVRCFECGVRYREWKQGAGRVRKLVPKPDNLFMKRLDSACNKLAVDELEMLLQQSIMTGMSRNSLQENTERNASKGARWEAVAPERLAAGAKRVVCSEEVGARGERKISVHNTAIGVSEGATVVDEEVCEDQLREDQLSDEQMADSRQKRCLGCSVC